MKKEKEKSVSSKKTIIEKEKEKTQKKYTDIFVKRFSDLIEEKCKEIGSDGKRIKQYQICDDLGITTSSLTNYVTERIPDKKELIYIKEYFNVPFSYLFGETPTINLDNSSIGLNLGLDDKAIEKLMELKKDASNDTIDKYYASTTKLFIINTLINDNAFLDSLAFWVLMENGKLEINKLSKTPIFISENFDEYLKFDLLIRLFKLFDETLTKGDNMPKSLKEKAVEIAKRYAGNKKNQIDELKK